ALDKLDDHRSHDHDHHRTWSKYQSGIGCGVSIKRLQHLRNEHSRAEEHKSKQEVVDIRNREIPLFQQTEFYYWIGVSQFPEDSYRQRHYCHCEERDDEVAFKPVFTLTAIEDHLKEGESNCNQQNSDIINLELAGFSCRFYLALELRRIRNDATGKNQ